MNSRIALFTVARTLCLVGMTASTAFADTCVDRALVLDCPVSATKSLTVCIGTDAATYAFGRKENPELELTRTLDDVTATAWPGAGRYIWENISFPNDDVRYEVNVSVDRNVKDAPIEGGVSVMRGEDELANLTCRTGEATGDVSAISGAFYDAGYCWDREEEAYTRDCAE